MAICGVRAREIGKRFSRSSTYGTRAKLILRKKHAEVQPPSPAENVAEVETNDAVASQFRSSDGFDRLSNEN